MANDALIPAIGDLVRIGPDVGVHGHGDPFWLRVLGVRDGLVLDHCYLRGYPIDEPGEPKTYYVQTSRLDIKRHVW